MKKLIFSLMTISALLLAGHTTNAQSKDKAAAEKLIYEYFNALNASDAGKVVSLFTEDGVLLPSAAPTAEGISFILNPVPWALISGQDCLRNNHCKKL